VLNPDPLRFFAGSGCAFEPSAQEAVSPMSCAVGTCCTRAASVRSTPGPPARFRISLHSSTRHAVFH
jgi:hypothetical protein